MKHHSRARCVAALLAVAAPRALADERAGPPYVPYNASGIYALGETVGWNVTLPWSSPGGRATSSARTTSRRSAAATSRPASPTKIEARLDEPGMVYVEVTENTPGAKPQRAGRRRRAREDRAVDSGARGFRRVLGGEDQGTAQGAR